MTDRVIPCPGCNGHGGDCDADDMGGTVSWQCASCFGSGTIPDRRAPSANDRAVDIGETVAEIKRLAMQFQDKRISRGRMLKTLYALCDSALEVIRNA